MSTNPTGLGANIARQVAQVNQKANADRNIQATANQGPSAAARASATAPTNTPQVTTAVAASGSAPAAPVGGTTAPTSPAAAARATAAAPTAPSSVAAAIGMATSGVFFAQVASAAVVATGKKSSDVSGKDETKDSAKATEADEKNNLALKDSNSQTGSEAGDISGANSANAPAA